MMNRAISGRSTVVASSSQISSDLGGEVVLLNVETGVYYGLDSVGTRIWELIQELRTVADIREAILVEYEVEPDRCERDLMALLQKLMTEGLIEADETTT